MSTILIVDDDALFRNVMRHHLQGMGYEVIENDSGVGVGEQIADYRPAACLIDIVMDKREGLETILAISEGQIPTKIIAVSGNPSYLDIAGDFGAHTVLVKPVSRDALVVALEEIGVRPD